MVYQVPSQGKPKLLRPYLAPPPAPLLPQGQKDLTFKGVRKGGFHGLEDNSGQGFLIKVQTQVPSPQILLHSSLQPGSGMAMWPSHSGLSVTVLNPRFLLEELGINMMWVHLFLEVTHSRIYPAQGKHSLSRMASVSSQKQYCECLLLLPF